MKKYLNLLFILIAFKLSSQCAYTITTSYTPATCPTCCNGTITYTLTGFGQSCAPISWSISPIAGTSFLGGWTNLCPGTYTVQRIDGGCCLVFCQVNLTFTQTGINQVVLPEFNIFYDNLENVIKLYNQPKNSTIKIFDLMGKAVKEKLLDIGFDQIDAKDLDEGVYIVVLFIDDKPQRQFKIIKQ